MERARAAAASNCQIETVRWLLAQGCPVKPMQICVNAAQGGSVELMTEYLQQVQRDNETAEAQQQLLTDMLNAAGAHCQLEAAMWARQRGAEWPEKLHFAETRTNWRGKKLEWARAAGCTAPLVYVDDNYSDEENYSDDYGAASDNSTYGGDGDAYYDSAEPEYGMQAL
jgi:hypothetical protein